MSRLVLYLDGSGMEVLDFWTTYSLEAYWKELVLETQKANYTGKTDEYDTGSTGA